MSTSLKPTASAVEDYLAKLPADRRELVSRLRDVVRQNLDPAYQEGVAYGMIGYSVPHSVFPAGYHCDPSKPLLFAAIGSQKSHVGLYLMGLYTGVPGDPRLGMDADWFAKAWKATGHKLDMGKACVRITSLDKVPLDVVGEAIRRIPAALYVERYLAARATVSKPATPNTAASKAKPAAKPASKAAGKKTPAKTGSKPSAKKTAKKARRTGAGAAKAR